MKRPTDVERLCRLLVRAPRQQLLKREAAAELGWTAEKLERIIDRAQSEERPLLRVRGGRSIRFRGDEAHGGSTGVGIYVDVQTGITNYWARYQYLRECVVVPTSRTRLRDGGLWARPDLVMYAHPRRRAHRDDPRLAHAIEVESVGGFSIKSVYQAHAQGHGADFSWVFFQQPALNKPRDWARITWAAAELGVGLVGFTNSNAVSTWELHRSADRQNPPGSARRTFRSWFPEPAPDAT